MFRAAGSARGIGSGEGLCCWICYRDKGNMELSCPEMMEGPLQVGDERRGVGGGA